MPPAFHFPEDQTPPSDLLASSVAASSTVPTTEHGKSLPHCRFVYLPFVVLVNRQKDQPVFIFAGGDDLYRNEPVDRPKDLTDNAMYPMMSQIYKEFDHLSPEEQARIQAMFAAAVQNRQAAADKMEMEDDSDNQVRRLYLTILVNSVILIHLCSNFRTR